MADEDDQGGGDAAAEAFETQRAELEALRAEQPDYSETLGRMSNNITAIAQRVDALARGWAQAVTPDHIAGRIMAASSDARRNDQQIITEARAGLDQATRQIVAWCCGRRLPRRSRAPYRKAGYGRSGWARTLDRPMRDAGQRMMIIAAPESWRAIVAGDKIVTANRDTIEACRIAAAEGAEYSAMHDQS